MKYKHRRRYRKVLRLKQITFRDIKKFAWIAFWVLIFFLGLTSFKGAPWPSRDSSPDVVVPERPKEVPETITHSSEVVVYFLIFLCLIYTLHRLLNWWFYEREDYLGNVRMVTDEERKKLQVREKIKQN